MNIKWEVIGLYGGKLESAARKDYTFDDILYLLEHQRLGYDVTAKIYYPEGFSNLYVLYTRGDKQYFKEPVRYDSIENIIEMMHGIE